MFFFCNPPIFELPEIPEDLWSFVETAKKTYPSISFCRAPTETKCLVFRDDPQNLKQIGQLADLYFLISSRNEHLKILPHKNPPKSF